jgi:DUF4097 and DUF4098 domain-containing protein YvlB
MDVAAGAVTLRLSDTTVTRVEVDSSWDDAVDRTRVELRGDELVIVSPRRSGLFRSTPEVEVQIEAPAGSSLDAELHSADLEVGGTLSQARVRTGSGDVALDRVTDELRADSGSGDVRVAYAGGGGALRSGSGDVEVEAVGGGRLQCNTGSGDITLGRVEATADVRSGSGDVSVEDTTAELMTSTASGDQEVRRAWSGTLRLRSASGDVHVGITGGAAAWLDISTVSGTVSSALDQSTEPGDDEPRVAVHVSTVSGDVDLVRS